jgi:hypothetical protein
MMNGTTALATSVPSLSPVNVSPSRPENARHSVPLLSR